MRSIVHEILARYLESDQFAFGESSRELWPWERTPVVRPLQQNEFDGGNREPEPQN